MSNLFTISRSSNRQEGGWGTSKRPCECTRRREELNPTRSDIFLFARGCTRDRWTCSGLAKIRAVTGGKRDLVYLLLLASPRTNLSSHGLPVARWSPPHIANPTDTDLDMRIKHGDSLSVLHASTIIHVGIFTPPCSPNNSNATSEFVNLDYFSTLLVNNTNLLRPPSANMVN